MASPYKKRSLLATVTTMVGGRLGKMFVNGEAKQCYGYVLCHHQYTIARNVDFDFFIKADIDSFRKFESISWGLFFTLNEPIFCEIVKEFYSNLIFDDGEFWASSMIKGQKIELTLDFIANVIGFPNKGVEHYYSHREVPYEGYSREKAIRELMEGK